DRECAVTVEGSDLDFAGVRNFAEAAPELAGEFDAAGGGLQIEAEEVNRAGNRPAVVEERADRCAPKRGAAEEDDLIAEVGGVVGFVDRWLGVAADAGDADEWRGAIGVGSVHLLAGECEHGSQQADRWIVDSELSGVDADGKTAGASGDVVAREG